ncbi:hypothetical protein Slin15195_G073330 [Septoria linicola]|uniref:Uncharacterized protein n=1 Tax=Septoria linicola TaxID=215465 RepID=A0A9Q9EL68_9PEZI|nr:hypothetical protein Slin15195_G073330 [Septoria linicola]
MYRLRKQVSRLSLPLTDRRRADKWHKDIDQSAHGHVPSWNIIGIDADLEPANFPWAHLQGCAHLKHNDPMALNDERRMASLDLTAQVSAINGMIENGNASNALKHLTNMTKDFNRKLDMLDQERAAVDKHMDAIRNTEALNRKIRQLELKLQSAEERNTALAAQLRTYATIERSTAVFESKVKAITSLTNVLQSLALPDVASFSNVVTQSTKLAEARLKTAANDFTHAVEDTAERLENMKVSSASDTVRAFREVGTLQETISKKLGDSIGATTETLRLSIAAADSSLRDHASSFQTKVDGRVAELITAFERVGTSSKTADQMPGRRRMYNPRSSSAEGIEEGTSRSASSQSPTTVQGSQSGGSSMTRPSPRTRASIEPDESTITQPTLKDGQRNGSGIVSLAMRDANGQGNVNKKRKLTDDAAQKSALEICAEFLESVEIEQGRQRVKMLNVLPESLVKTMQDELSALNRTTRWNRHSTQWKCAAMFKNSRSGSDVAPALMHACDTCEAKGWFHITMPVEKDPSMPLLLPRRLEAREGLSVADEAYWRAPKD